MDWSRTKTILILALILTNGVLFYAVYGDRIASRNEEAMNDTQLTDVIELLNSHEIILESEIPDKYTVLPDLRLAYENYEGLYIVDLLLGETYSEVDGRYLSRDAEVRILGSHDLVYSPLNPMGGEVKTDVGLAKSVAQAFLSDKGLSGKSVELWNATVLDSGDVLVAFRQVEDGYFLETAYMDVVVRGEEVVTFKRKWFGSIEILDTSKTIEAPAKALFRLIPAVEDQSGLEKPVRIVSMDLGYRLISNILTINFQEGEPTPYWRFKTDTGKTIYIEAHSSE